METQSVTNIATASMRFVELQAVYFLFLFLLAFMLPEGSNPSQQVSLAVI